MVGCRLSQKSCDSVDDAFNNRFCVNAFGVTPFRHIENNGNVHGLCAAAADNIKSFGTKDLLLVASLRSPNEPCCVLLLCISYTGRRNIHIVRWHTKPMVFVIHKPVVAI